MDTLRVGVEALQGMTVRWSARAAELGAGAPPRLGLSCQPSAVAVNAAHLAIEAAAASLMGRMQDNATKVAAADAGYVANEASSVARFEAVAGQLTAF